MLLHKDTYDNVAHHLDRITQYKRWLKALNYVAASCILAISVIYYFGLKRGSVLLYEIADIGSLVLQ